MKKLTICLCSLFIFVFLVLYNKHTDNVFNHLQKISCIIHTSEDKYGSGVIVVSNGHAFVITANHVVSKTKFEDVQVIQFLYHGDKFVGKQELLAKIVKKSPKEDLALLYVYGKGIFNEGAHFYHNKNPIPLGSPLVVVGSPFGEDGYNTTVTGVLSQYDRHNDGNEFDEASCLVFPGNSGCGVFLSNGNLAGIAVGRIRTGACLFVPMRQIRQWASRENLRFLLDKSQEIPPEIVHE